MKPLRYDPEQRFTCARCTRCCRHRDAVVTAAEAEALRRPALARLWSEGGELETAAGSPQASETELVPDPFEPVAGGLFRIRRRADGACGFLAADGACRIHAERGADKKPLACRLFPFQLHPSEGPALVTASFSCPTVAENTGTALGDQLRDVSSVAKDWARAFPASAPSPRFTAERPLSGAAAGEARSVLRGLWERRTSHGHKDLRQNAARIGALLDDWTRYRVLKLEDDAFAEYLALTGRFAVATDKPVADERPSRVGRLLLRAFLLAAVAARLQARGPRRGLRLGLRARLVRVALHLHGLWPASEGVDLGAARSVRVNLDEPGLHGLAHHFVRSTLETLPTGRRPLVDELCFAFATLETALTLGRMRAAGLGRDRLLVEDFVAGITEAADLGQTEGPLAALLRTLTGGLDAVRAFAQGGKT